MSGVSRIEMAARTRKVWGGTISDFVNVKAVLARFKIFEHAIDLQLIATLREVQNAADFLILSWFQNRLRNRNGAVGRGGRIAG